MVPQRIQTGGNTQSCMEGHKVAGKCGGKEGNYNGPTKGLGNKVGQGKKNLGKANKRHNNTRGHVGKRVQRELVGNTYDQEGWHTTGHTQVGMGTE